MPRRTEDFLEGELTSDIIGAMYETHQELGFGYRELIYSRALEVLLTETGHRVDREVAVTVYFRGVALATQVMDMIVDDKAVSYTHLRAHETPEHLVCRLLLE